MACLWIFCLLFYGFDSQMKSLLRQLLVESTVLCRFRLKLIFRQSRLSEIDVFSQMNAEFIL
jgi:hypothetical protein